MPAPHQPVLDDSKARPMSRYVGGNAPRQHGAEVTLRRGDAIEATRTLHPGNQQVHEHAHDWPLLSLQLIGGFAEESEEGRHVVDRPAAVFHPRGRAHSDAIAASGLQTVVLAIDPGWLRHVHVSAPSRSAYWLGGRVGCAGSALARRWLDRSLGDADLLAFTARFLQQAMHGGAAPAAAAPPRWLADVQARIAAAPVDALPDTATLADALHLHPGWLAQAYRAHRGEGLQEMLRRRRVEHAVSLLQADAHAALAEVAVACGFCDQSHMNRAFAALLARTPAQVRVEGALVRGVE